MTAAESAATTYYVNAVNGSDVNSGASPNQPWRTIQKAANTLTAGQTVIVLPGNYPERVQITQSGASGAPITYQAQGTVTMKGFTVTANNISLIGFDITNTDDNWKNGWGIFVEGRDCLIEGNYVHFATRGGIMIYSEPGNEANTGYCTLRNNRLYRNAMAGMELSGRNNLVEGNEIWGTIQYHPNWHNPPSYVDADGIRFFGFGHTIRNNYIHDISYSDPENVNPHIDCFQTWDNSDYEAAQYVVVERNFCENLEYEPYAGAGQAFMLENASHITIRNNILWAFCGVNAVDSQWLTIVNNTLASDLSFPAMQGPSGISLTRSPRVTIKNNIFYDFPAPSIWIPDSASQQGLDAGYNLVYRSDGHMPSGTHYPHDLWQVNPGFVNVTGGDFHVQSSSVAIDAGTPLTSVPNDFDASPRPEGPTFDIGAYEYLYQNNQPLYLPLIYRSP